MRYVKGYDTLRAFAVLFVIVYHWGPFFPEHTVQGFLMQVFVPDGTFGVNLFFVLSGFLITSILLNERHKDNGAHKMTIIKNFFIRRILRIFPIYYLTMGILLIAGMPYLREHLWYFLLYASNLLPYKYDTVNPLIHTWSLAVEEQFYLIWPWLIIFIRERYLKYVFILSVIIGIVSKAVVLIVWHHHFTTLVFNCFDAFGLGGLYAYMRLNSERSARFEKGYFIFLAFMLFIGVRLSSVAGSPPGLIYYRSADSFISLAIIILVTKNKNQWVSKYILENKVLNFIGKISYGLYLYHYILGAYYDWYVAQWAKSPAFPKVLAGYWVSYGIKFTLLIIVCWLSYKLIEQPILRWKKKFEYR